MSFAKLLLFLKRHWGKLFLIVIFGKPFFLFFLIFISFTISEVYSRLFDQSSVADSKHMGRQVNIAPFASLVRMKDYGGWKDKYLYFFATAPEYNRQPGAVSTIALSDYAIFKVIDVKIMTGEFLGGGGGIICIMQNINNLKQIASEKCDELDALEELTDIFHQAESNINEFGSAFISASKMGSKPFKKVLDVNSFSVYQISSKQELISFLQENLGSLNAYKYVIGKRKPYLLKKEELHDDRKIALLLDTTGFAESWEDNNFGDTKFRSYLNKNELPDEVENWIKLKYSSSRDRWVFRTLTSFLQRMILNQEKMSIYDAKKSLDYFEEVTQCLNVYFDDYSKYNEHVKELKNKFFEDPNRLLKYENVVDRSRDFSLNKYKYYPNGCRNFSPPSWIVVSGT